MKSHVRDLTDIAVCIYKDATAKCAATQLEHRDIVTLISRAEHEGLSFFTITLPSLGEDFERSLSLGRIDSTYFRSFRKYGKIPAFLRGFFSHVFSKVTGGILLEPDITAIEAIRQIAYSFKKLEVECDPRRVAERLQGFKQSEHELQQPIAQNDVDTFVNVSRVLWHTLDPARNLQGQWFLPKHGPGATAEKLSGNAKFKLSRWHDRLEPYFPLLHNVFSSENAYDSEEFEKVSIIPENEEQPVRVVTVPKTLKGPRIIAIEPVCMQYTQQAISQALVKELETYVYTKGHVNFTDQSINQRMAMIASNKQNYATLDLSAASDRVPNSLIGYMFEQNPDLQGAIQACRSKQAQMPDGEIIHLQKFASMGSALCFPVESMYFYTICIAALLEKRNLPVTSLNVFKVSRDVFVYGDDILVPTHDAAAVIDGLQKYYCKVNISKSFWTGRFRESCGMDAYDGQEVTPTYVRHPRPHNRREAGALISWVKTSNLFYKKGYWLTSSAMISVVETILGTLPIVGPKCSGLGKVSFQNLVSSKRWNKEYQVMEVRTWCPVPVYRKDTLEGYHALTKCLTSLERRVSDCTSSEEDHLSRTARHGAVTLKRRWIRPY